MKHVAWTLVVCLIAFTALAMALHPSFSHITVVWLGPIPIYIFDVLLLLSSVAFFYAVSLRAPTDASPANRTVLRVTGAYVLYQIIVVMTVAVIWYDDNIWGAYAGVTARIALVLIPFFYYVGLRHMSPEKVVSLVNVAAVCLFVYAVYRYLFVGATGSWEEGVYRLRVLWGGSTLMFGWLALTGPFLERRPFRAYTLGIAGILGIVLVNQRSGYVALLLAFAAYVLLSRRITRRVVTIAVLVLAGGAILTAASPTIRESVAYSLTTMFNPSSDAHARDRVQRTALAWDYVKAHPLGDSVWVEQYYLVNLGTNGFEPHNFVIQALDKQGWISAGLLFILIAAVLWVGWTTRTRSRLATVMTAYLVFYLGFCLFNTNFDDIQNVTLFALTVALILSANRACDEPHGQRPRQVGASPGE